MTTVVVANALEFFDYFAFATFAVYIGSAFFPAHDSRLASLAAFGTFATGFLLRPVGAIVLGRYADRKGRKPALLLTASLITFGTLAVAVLPSYHEIGLFAPALLVGCRMVQGFAIGGEMGASTALLCEQAGNRRTGYYCGWLLAGQGIALLAAGCCGLILASVLPTYAIADWGWRIPFALGALMVPLQIRLRRGLRESLTKTSLSGDLQNKEPKAKGVSMVMLGMLLIVGGTVPTYVATFAAPYELSGIAPTLEESFVLTACLGLVTFLSSIAGGWLSDRFGQAPLIILARAASIVVVFPTYAFGYVDGNEHLFMAGIVLVTACSVLGAAPTIAMILSIVPRQSRAMSLSFIYATGVAAFGSTAPAVVTALNRWTDSRTAAAWYIASSAGAAILAVVILRRPPRREQQI